MCRWLLRSSPLPHIQSLVVVPTSSLVTPRVLSFLALDIVASCRQSSKSHSRTLRTSSTENRTHSPLSRSLSSQCWGSRHHQPSLAPSRRPSLDKLLQILHRRDAQHEPPILVRDDGETLAPAAVRPPAPEEGLEVLERRLHGDDLVRAPLALEARHGGRQGVVGLDAAGVELRLQARDGDVAQQGARLGVDDGEVRVVALEGGEEGEGDGVGRVEGEGGGRVEVFYCGLGRGLSEIRAGGIRSGDRKRRRLTPR